MTLGGETLLSVGYAVARVGLRLWLKDEDVARESSLELASVVQRKIRDPLERNKARREFERVAENVASRLAPYFTTEFRGLPDHEIQAAALALEASLAEMRINADVLLEADLDPLALERRIRQDATGVLTSAALSEAATQLYSFALAEACNYIIEITASIPAFRLAATRELLKRETELSARVDTALAHLPTRATDAGDDPSDRFEREYVREVARRLDELEIFGLDVHDAPRRFTLSVAYITLSVASTESDDDPEKDAASSSPEDADGEEVSVVRVDRALSPLRRAVIKGDAGLGKTTLLQWLAVSAARSSFSGPLDDWNDTVPFFIRLRHYARDPLPAPEEWCRAAAPSVAGDMPHGWVHRQLREGRALVLVDGVDELPEARRTDVQAWIRDLDQTFPDSRYVVTSRPAAIRQGWLSANRFAETDLQPMTPGDVRAFIEHWHRAAAEQVTDDALLAELTNLRGEMQRIVRERPTIRALATTPLLCAMLCALHRERRRKLPEDRVQLYRIAIDLLLERRDVERQVVADEGITLSLTEKELLLQTLAYSLIVNENSDVDREAAVEMTRRQLESMPHVRYSAEEVFQTLLERSGLLRQPVPGRIDFIHRTFQEYLAAREALDQNHINLLIRESVNDQWRETIILAAGLAQSAQREALITGIIERGDAEEVHRHRLHLLAAACLETSPRLGPELTESLRERLFALVPPKTLTDARALSSAGDLAAPLLAFDPEWRAVRAAAAVRALGLIGTDTAFEILRGYGSDTRVTVARELLRAWANFDPVAYAREIIAESPLDNGKVRVDDVSVVSALSLLEHLHVVFWELDSLPAELQGLVQVDAWVAITADSIADESLDVLAGMHRLYSLTLQNAASLTDISALGSAQSLSHLDLRGAFNLQDISALEGLSSLRTAVLDNSQIRSLAPLWTATRLERLECSWCRDLEDIRVIASMPELTRLDLRDCSALMDVGPIAEVPTLRQLWIGGVPGVVDLGFVVNAKELQDLDITACEDIIALDGVTARISSLRANSCVSLIEANGLSDPSGLTEVYLGGCVSLRSCERLAGAHGLRQFVMSDAAHLEDFGFLAGKERMLRLTLDGCEGLTNLEFARGMRGLSRLSIRGCRNVTDLRPLADCHNLRMLFIDDCEGIEDLAPLAELKSLQWVSMQRVDADTAPLRARADRYVTVVR